MKLATVALVLGLCINTGWGLTCDPEKFGIKVTIKITDPTEFDSYEQYLFTGVVAYSIRKYCGETPATPCQPSSLHGTDTVNVHLSNITDRFAMCVKVDDCTNTLLQTAIKDSKPRFNGALVLTDETLLVEGIPVTMKPQVIPDFPIWLIPFIVFICLVVIAAISIISYTAYQTKKKKKIHHDDDDTDSLSAPVYENVMNGDTPTVTAM